MVRGGDEEWRRKRRKLFGKGKLVQRHKNLGSRVALLPGKFLRVRKDFAQKKFPCPS